MPPIRRTSLTSLAAVTAVVALALPGCGGSSKSNKTTTTAQSSADKAAVTQVLSDLQAASRAGDGKRICNEIFTPKLADSVTASAKSGSCAKEVKAKLFSPKAKISVGQVTISDPVDALAVITEASGNTSKVFLVKQSNRWRIRSVQPA
jgi:hypothetical protein